MWSKERFSSINTTRCSTAANPPADGAEVGVVVMGCSLRRDPDPDPAYQSTPPPKSGSWLDNN